MHCVFQSYVIYNVIYYILNVQGSWRSVSSIAEQLNKLLYKLLHTVNVGYNRLKHG